MLSPVTRYVRRKGFTLLCPEVPFFEHRIDLFGLSVPTGYTIAIELKLKKWRRALEQALVYQLCSDYVYIALPWEQGRYVELAELVKNRIGLILVGRDKCRTALVATKSLETRDYYRREYAELLRRGTL